MVDGYEKVEALEKYFVNQLIEDQEFQANPVKYIKHFCTIQQEKLEDITPMLQQRYNGDDEEITSLELQKKHIQAYLNLAECYGDFIEENEILEFQKLALRFMGIARGHLDLLTSFYNSK